MKKYIVITALLIMAVGHGLGQTLSFYDHVVRDVYGADVDLAELRGKKVMVVNVASKCGLTPQYEQLEEIYRRYKDSGFTVVAFPANDFREQEPGTDQEIISFCKLNYGVTFPVMSKISVVGEDAAPVYRWLTRKELNGVMDAQVEWNFHKFLIDENGAWVASYSPRTPPDHDEIVAWIEGKE